MGYYTYHTLSFVSGVETEEKYLELIAELRSDSEDANYALTENGNTDNPCKWYSHEHELREFSKKHPDVVFELYGEGENATDIWVEYYQDGKCQREAARITIDPFNPEKLK